jgi:hypothetical protein
MTAPVLELALLAPIAAFGGSVDRLRAAERLLATITPPLLRATARRGAAARVDVDLIGPALGELLDARGLMLLAAARASHQAAVVSSWRLSPADLRPGALDARRPPFRTAGGMPRPGDAGGLLASPSPATVLPLSSGGRVEGWLLVVHGASTDLEAAPQATVEICDALAAELAAARLRSERDPRRTLTAAATALDEETGALAEAAARARTGLALLVPTGATQWKNARFDEALAAVAPRAAGDLGRVVALFRRVGEPALETVQRLLAGPRSRAVAAELRLVATVTRTGGALLVEIDALDGSSVAALASSPMTSPAPVFATADPG